MQLLATVSSIILFDALSLEKSVNQSPSPDMNLYYGRNPQPSALSPQQQLALLDTHPLFTGRCPQCEMPFPVMATPPTVWICKSCQWHYPPQQQAS